MALVLHAYLKPDDTFDGVEIIIHRREPVTLGKLLDEVSAETAQARERELGQKTRIALLEAEIVRLGGTVPP